MGSDGQVEIRCSRNKTALGEDEYKEIIEGARSSTGKMRLCQTDMP